VSLKRTPRIYSLGATVVQAVRVKGTIDEQQRLAVDGPVVLSPGPVMVWIVPADEDDAGNAWGAAIAEEWHKELSDVRQDIYTLADGEPLHDA